MRLRSLTRLLALTVCCAFAQHASAAFVVLDDFNVDEGHFNLAPNFSGSSANIAASSTADRVTTGSYEGAGNEELVLNTTTAGNATRLRFLSGGGSAGSNTAFTLGAGPDGWIGVAVKTTTPDWNVQIWMEGPENNGSVPKNIIADGQWHVYQWNLDDETGGADGWGAVSGIVGGDSDVAPGNYTIDSVLFRHAAGPAASTISMDYLAINTTGMVPEPATLSLAAMGLIGMIAAARRKS